MSASGTVSNRQPADWRVFGRNVRAHRKALGLLIKDLAKESGLGVDTIRRIERGQPCYLDTQKKLAKCLTLTVEALWLTESMQKVHHFGEDSSRWAFFDVSQAASWALNEDSQKLDPDSIQDPVERHRLGFAGLADSFVRRFRCALPDGIHGSVLVEIYREMYTVPNRQCSAMGYFCLRGQLRFILGEDDVRVLREGELIVVDQSVDCKYEPLDPVGPRDRPPLLLAFWVNPGRKVGHEERKS